MLVTGASKFSKLFNGTPRPQFSTMSDQHLCLSAWLGPTRDAFDAGSVSVSNQVRSPSITVKHIMSMTACKGQDWKQEAVNDRYSVSQSSQSGA
jgi:hypothetical protein